MSFCRTTRLRPGYLHKKPMGFLHWISDHCKKNKKKLCDKQKKCVILSHFVQQGNLHRWATDVWTVNTIASKKWKANVRLWTNYTVIAWCHYQGCNGVSVLMTFVVSATAFLKIQKLMKTVLSQRTKCLNLFSLC